MELKKKAADLMFSLVTTVIAVAGIVYGKDFNVVAAILLCVGTFKSCYSGLLEKYNVKVYDTISFVVNMIMMCLTIYLLFITIGVYNGSNELDKLKVLSHICIFKAAFDFIFEVYLLRKK